MIFKILAENVAKITKAAFYLSRLTFCQKTFLEKKKSTLAVFQGKNLRISAGKCLEEISEGTNSAKKGNSNPSLYLGEKASNFSPKVPSKAVRTAFYVSKGWILGKKRKYTVLWFSRTPRKFFWLYAKSFLQDYQLCIILTQGEFCEKFLFELCASQSRISSDNRWGAVAQKFSVGLWIQNVQIILFQKKNLLEYLSIFFGLWAVTSQILTKKTMTGLPKLPSTVSEIFRGEKLSHQKKFFPSVSDFELRIFGLLFKNFGSLTKTALYMSRGDFRREKILKLKSISASVCEFELLIFKILAKNVANITKAAFYLSSLTFC